MFKASNNCQTEKNETPAPVERPHADMTNVAVPMRFQNIGALYNPISGKALGQKYVDLCAAALHASNQSLDVRTSAAVYDPTEITAWLKSKDLVIVAGGDGTVMGLLPYLAETGTPIYMMPSGNESLFARNFGMTRDPGALLERLRRGAIEQHYLGLCNSRPFFSMIGVGVDSVIIADIQSSRTKAIGHLGYVKPIIRALSSYELPDITMLVDGKKVIDNEGGYLIICNTPEYALKMNPVPEASSRLPRLHGRFFPNLGIGGIAKMFAGAAFGRRANTANARFFEGTEFQVSVSNEKPFPVQADGESVGVTPIEVRINSKPISVLAAPAR